MKKGLLILLLFSAAVCQGQILAPVKWAYGFKKINSSTIEIHLKASIQPGWHIYSGSTPEGGPLPTQILVDKKSIWQPVGPINETGKVITRYEKAFELDVKYFENSVDFVQVLKLKNKGILSSVSGTVSFMACTDKKCLSPETINYVIAVH